MKVKILRDKETKEFVHILRVDDKFQKFTGEIPHVLPETSSISLLGIIYPLDDCHFDDFDDVEMVEYDLIEGGEIGADIRNKLSPPKNLVVLLDRYFDMVEGEKKDNLKVYILESMVRTNESVDYLAQLL